MQESTDDNDVVLKLDMHCSGCVKKLKKFLRTIPGVEAVRVNSDLNKLTVTGKLDPFKLRVTLANKTNKKVDLISPQPTSKTASGVAEKPSPPLPEKPKEAEEVKEAPKPKPEVKQSMVILKTKLHCDGCIQKIRKIVARFKGVQDVEINGVNDLVRVTGTMDLTELIPYLVEKLRRNVELVANAKKDCGSSGDKKVVDTVTVTVTSPAENAAGDNNANAKKDDKVLKKKETEEESNDHELVNIEAQKMMHQPNYSSYNYNYDRDAAGPSNSNWHGGDDQRYFGGGRGVGEEGNVGYVVEHYQYQNHHHHHAPPEPGMFSDENPNGCYVM